MGYQFIPIRRAHLEFLSFVFKEAAPPIEQCFGRSMVDRDFILCGFAVAWLRPRESRSQPLIVTIHAYFGDYFRRYPKDILRGLKVTIDRLREAGIYEVWATADESIPGSRTLCEWFGGVPSGQRVDGEGEYFRIDLTKTPI